MLIYSQLLSRPAFFRGLLISSAFVVFGAWTGVASAQSATNGAALYPGCSGCHGMAPFTANASKIKNGVSAANIKNAAYGLLGKGGGSMGGYTSLTDTQYNDLAAYIASSIGGTSTCVSSGVPTASTPATVVACPSTTAPAVTLSSTAAQAFGSVTTGTTSTAHSITLTNSGTAALSITSISTTNAAFAVSHTCGTSVAAGLGCTLNITYAPQVVGAASGNLSIVTNAGTNTVALSGTGVAPVVTAPTVSLSTASQAFGSVTTGTTSAAQTITLTNTGTAALNITSIGTSHAAFTVSHTCGTSLAATGSCVISIRFAPTVSGAVSGTLSLVTNAGSSPNTVTLSGTGVAPVVTAPVVSLSPAIGLNFSATVGTPTLAQTVTLTNSGTAALVINSISATNAAFTVSHTCGISVAVGASCAINIVFTPAVAGQTPANVVIATNASSTASTVAMVGTGMAVGVPTALLHWDSPVPFSFGTSVAVGTSLSHTFTLSNAGTVAANSVLLALNGTDLADFQITGPCLATGGVTLAPLSSCQITVTFAPTTGGAKSVSLGVTGQGGTLPTALALSGTALASTSGLTGAGVTPNNTSSAAASSGGCTLGAADQPIDPLWLLILGAAAWVLRRRRFFPV
ncbi:MAG: choice-of-anchor D domain-containing protein [Leptothrix ochracea]|uniref:choice-of-anchor D domain-containing protein n=1 Tax=Leptothrix ochracea TaxID=735331 RepID=UPI0034E222A1